MRRRDRGRRAVIFSYTANVGEVFREDQVRTLTQEREDRVRLLDQAREDELRDVVTGELLPRTSTSVLLVIPADVPENDPWRVALGDSCIREDVPAEPLTAGAPTSESEARAKPVPATLVDVGHPGTTDGPISQPGTAIFRVVTARTDECAQVVDGWVPPDWVTLPSSGGDSEEKPAQSTATTSASDTATPASGSQAGGEG